MEFRKVVRSVRSFVVSLLLPAVVEVEAVVGASRILQMRTMNGINGE